MTEMQSRRRRAIRACAYAVLIPVLLLGAYFSSVVSFCFGYSAGILPEAMFDNAIWEGFTLPVAWYIEDSEWPGAEMCEAIVRMACDTGEYIGYGS